MHLHFSGRWQEALEMYERSAAIGREMGDVKQWAGAAMLKAILHNQVGAFDEGLDLCRQVAEAGREVSDGQIIAWGLGGQGKSLMFPDEIDQAEAHFAGAVPVLQRVPDLLALLSTLNDQAIARMFQGDEDRALEILARAHRIIDKRSLVVHSVWGAHYTWADLCLRLEGREDRNAQGPSDPLNAAMDKIRKIAGKQRMFRPHYLRLVGRHARITRGDKQALAWWNGVLREAKALENRLEEGLTYLEMGQGLQEPGCL